jgi:hypothetical protein
LENFKKAIEGARLVDMRRERLEYEERERERVMKTIEEVSMYKIGKRKAAEQESTLDFSQVENSIEEDLKFLEKAKSKQRNRKLNSGF